MSCWKYEVSSGFPGYRNIQTGEWLYLDAFNKMKNQVPEIQHIKIESNPLLFLDEIDRNLREIGNDFVNVNNISIKDGTISFEVTDENRSCLDFINAVAFGWNLRSKV
jgi:hypothetical protein